jgi:D-amino-acid dehydrogenase
VGHTLSERIAIVGSGIIGLCSAYFLVEKGYTVTVFDPKELGNCSVGNAGMVVPSHFVPLAAPGMVQMGLKMLLNPESPFGFHLPPSVDQLLWSWKFIRSCTKVHVQKHESLLRDMNLESRALYDQMSEKLGIGFEWHKKGLLMLCAKQETLEAEAHLAERANQIGVRAEILDSAKLKSVDPTIEMAAIGAVHFLDDGHLTPESFLQKLRLFLELQGVDFVSRMVVSLEMRNDSPTVATADEVRSFQQVILATGALSSELARKLHLRLPMMAGKGYSFNLPNPVQTPELCSILVEARVAVTPMTSGLRFAGTMEIGPPNETVNPKRLNGIKKSIPKYFPQFKEADFEEKEVWLGHRPCSPDGIPYVGRIQHRPQFIVATGHSMMGLSLGPISGQYVAKIVSGEISDTGLLDPNRYA